MYSECWKWRSFAFTHAPSIASIDTNYYFIKIFSSRNFLFTNTAVTMCWRILDLCALNCYFTFKCIVMAMGNIPGWNVQGGCPYPAWTRCHVVSSWWGWSAVLVGMIAVDGCRSCATSSVLSQSLRYVRRDEPVMLASSAAKPLLSSLCLPPHLCVSFVPCITKCDDSSLSRWSSLIRCYHFSAASCFTAASQYASELFTA